MNKLDLLLGQVYVLKKDVEDWENRGYIISNFVKNTVDNMIECLEIKRRQNQLHKRLRELIE